MGERANIVIKQGYRTDDRVWLYGHWIGTRTLDVVKTVIERGERLDDPPYLARIVFEEMIPENQRGDSTSYGISTIMADNNYPIIVLDPEHGTAWIEDAEASKPVPFADFARAIVSGSFETTIYNITVMNRGK